MILSNNSPIHIIKKYLSPFDIKIVANFSKTIRNIVDYKNSNKIQSEALIYPNSYTGWGKKNYIGETLRLIKKCIYKHNGYFQIGNEGNEIMKYNLEIKHGFAFKHFK